MRARHHFAFGVLLSGLGLGRAASAQSIIKHPGEHPTYSFEAEPHLAIAPFRDDGVGPGFRGTFVALDNGFVPSINDSIGVGIGLDWVFYGEHCEGTPRGCATRSDVILPVVLQWNFWLTPRWSVFGEPGIAFHIRNHEGNDFAFDAFAIYGGGRFQFNDKVALTLRLGAPLIHDNVISIGVSFLL
ncbi:MAG TPA: hypothetical protein VH062_23930 [Polyangiaceae bacterium]|jgi:hypothetical protein|nr:hypothetical protein [Polyangiaceae bacterium]